MIKIVHKTKNFISGFSNLIYLVMVVIKHFIFPKTSTLLHSIIVQYFFNQDKAGNVL